MSYDLVYNLDENELVWREDILSPPRDHIIKTEINTGKIDAEYFLFSSKFNLIPQSIKDFVFNLDVFLNGCYVAFINNVLESYYITFSSIEKYEFEAEYPLDQDLKQTSYIVMSKMTLENKVESIFYWCDCPENFDMNLEHIYYYFNKQNKIKLYDNLVNRLKENNSKRFILHKRKNGNHSAYILLN